MLNYENEFKDRAITLYKCAILARLIITFRRNQYHLQSLNPL